METILKVWKAARKYFLIFAPLLILCLALYEMACGKGGGLVAAAMVFLLIADVRLLRRERNE